MIGIKTSRCKYNIYDQPVCEVSGNLSTIRFNSSRCKEVPEFCVACGTLPTVTHDNFYVSSTDSEEISIGPVMAQRVGITTGTTTTIDFPEGTGSPFCIGDAVSLTVSGQSNFRF